MIRIEIRKSEQINADYSLFVSFPYDADIVDIIRNQMVKFWDKDTKEWELSVKSLDNLIKDLSEYDIEIFAEDISVLNEKVELPKEFIFKTQPYKHQIEGVQYGLKNNAWLLGDEQGLGKTKEIIDLAVVKKIQKGYKHCLIICCVNGLKWNWQSEISIHSNEESWILGQRVNKKGKLVIGSIQDRMNDLYRISELPYFIITNIESLRSPELAGQLSDLCEIGEIGMIAADELHMCKNVTAQQSKGFLELRADTMIAMTGTPLMNSPMDLYIFLKWLGYETHSFYSFKNHYCVMGGYNNYEIVDYRHLDELQDKLNTFMLRRLKKDVLDLPEKTRVTEYVDMTPKQAVIYREVHNELSANIDKIKASNNPLAEMIRLRQATGYTGILSSTIQESAKLDRMEELVEESIANNKQVVIFSNWTQMTDAIYERLHQKYTLSVITGQTPDDLRQHNVKEFQEGRSKVMIGTIGAMGTGLTLTAGTIEIFMDEPWNRAKKEQAEDRCHRVGTTENITIYTLICKDTIDERIYNLVQEKGMMADKIVDGKVVGDKGQLVDYLLS